MLSVSPSSSYPWWRMAGYAGEADAGHAREPCGGFFSQMGLWEGPVEIDERKCQLWATRQSLATYLQFSFGSLLVLLHHPFYVNIWKLSNGQPCKIWTNTEWMTSVSSWLTEVKLEITSCASLYSFNTHNNQRDVLCIQMGFYLI